MSSIYLHPCTPLSCLSNSPALIDNFHITSTLLSFTIPDLKDNTHAGPDDIPSYFIKKCYFSLEKSLLLIFNRSLFSGVFPDLWKDALIYPIYNSVNKNVASNYRHIAILNVISNVIDKMSSTLIDILYSN